MITVERVENEWATHWALNDPAHQVEHFREVLRTGRLIAEHQVSLTERTDQLLILASYFHDLFAWSRVNHHKLSQTFIQGTDHPMFDSLTKRERMSLAYACGQHRASFKGEFFDDFAVLVNSADRGEPTSAKELVLRAIEFRKHHMKGESQESIVRNSIKHVQEKYGHKGYARYPEMYLDTFSKQLSVVMDEISALSPETFL